jgi:hypothetical protein
MPQHHLAQINIARLRHPIDDPRLKEFAAALGRINTLAERSPGFVWRYPAGDGHLDGSELLGDPLVVVNLSVWVSYQHLHDFTYRSHHGHFLRRRAEWFTKSPSPTTALWWIAAHDVPTPHQGLARLNHLRRYGPTPQAFTVRRRFHADGTLDQPVHVQRRRYPP